MGDDGAVKEFPDEKQRLAVCQTEWEKGKDSMKRERRFVPIEAAEFRIVRQEGEPTKVEGHAAVFDSLSQELFGFREKIKKGAFRSALKRPDDVRALINHDPNLVLGRNTSKTLRLKEDDAGLFFSVDLPDTSYARDLAESIDRGDISQCSFGFRTLKDQWETNDEGPDIRTLMDVELFDISPVTYPAYTDTAVALRSRDMWAQSHKPDFALKRRKLDLLAKM